MERIEETIKETIEETMTNAFWDLIDVHHPEHLKNLMMEIKEKLCSFVPNRKDIHEDIDKDLGKDEINWETLYKLIDWIELFQAPVHDATTKIWRSKLKTQINLSDFLKFYYKHLEIVHKDVVEYKTKKNTNGSNVPDRMKTGR
tara:strand:+ start:173 stop:604 length:432 start_codon:yes stop_codon:yes gene_type:complete